MKKTLGGERLGAGKRMKVELHGYERSTHDLGYVWRSTMSAGTLVPFMCKVALPGDTFDIDLVCDMKTHPTIGPLLGSMKVQLDVFEAPIRLYNSYLHNNMLGIGMNMGQIKLPQINFTIPDQNGTVQNIEDIDNSQINPSCILAYLGIRGIGINTSGADASRDFNAVPLLAYWEIYKNYYSNKQEKKGAVIQAGLGEVEETVDEITVSNGGTGATLPPTPAADLILLDAGTTIEVMYTGTLPPADTIMVETVGRGWVKLSDLGTVIETSPMFYRVEYNNNWYQDRAIRWAYQGDVIQAAVAPRVAFFNLDNLDDMRKAILKKDGDEVFRVNEQELEPYRFLTDEVGGLSYRTSTQEGLGVKTYQSDLFNNWLNTADLDDIEDRTQVSTIAGSFSIGQLNLTNKVYEMLQRLSVSGGTYDDWLDVTYDHNRMQKAESPIYHGGLIKELVFQEVVSNSQGETEPLGKLAGRGVMSGKHKGGKVLIRVSEPSYLIGIVSITPRVDYSQGNEWDTHLEDMDDLHKPQLDEIGFQDLITEQMAWWDTYSEVPGTWTQRSAGKQPAWINYMTSVNKTLGNFAITDNEMFMTLNRRYEHDFTGDPFPEIYDLTTYIDPVKFNFIFADASIDAQNFWCQIAVNITARRKMSAKIMPNL